MDISARELLIGGTLCYGVAFGAAIICQRFESKPARWVPMALLWVGFLVQFGGLFQRGEETHVFPLGNTFELLQMFAWGVVALSGFLRLTFSLRLPVSFIAALAALIGACSFANPNWDHAASTIYRGNPWVEFHVVMIILGYCFFAAQALNSVVFLLQDYSLKHRRFTGVFRLLPSLRQVDQVGVQLLAAGVCLLTLGMIVGVANFSVTAPSSSTVIKLLCAIVVWIGYGVVLFLRQKKSLRGPRFALASLLMFLIALITLWPANAARPSGLAETTPVSSTSTVAP
ncbi:MAG: cytochrome c biogenesis protein CcsA [Puniceicoccales bacterium]|jgi:ABC-type uncharacterized transport system permease subunit|nr:cytochrome c biogenesis protein CcsA [Puniceicoccales bacterium]